MNSVFCGKRKYHTARVSSLCGGGIESRDDEGDANGVGDEMGWEEVKGNEGRMRGLMAELGMKRSLVLVHW